MNLVPLIIQLVSGAVGGNVAGALLKKFDLGPIGNSSPVSSAEGSADNYSAC